MELYIHDVEDISKHACGGNTGTSAITLYYHRVGGVTLGVEHNDLIGTLKVVEWMLYVYSLQRHAGLGRFGICSIKLCYERKCWPAFSAVERISSI